MAFAPPTPAHEDPPQQPPGAGEQQVTAPSAAGRDVDAPPATGPWAPDRAEPGSAEAIRSATTDEDYLPPSVAYVPESESVPSPSDHLGHLAGAPGELSSVEEVHGYFRALAEASPRVWVESLGVTEEGREILLAVVTSEANLADLDRLTEINRALADPRRTPREEAEALAEGGKAFYYLLGGLHSTETGSPEMLMELAYRLAVSERPEIREIRDGSVVLITPVVEPDGRDRVVEWYERHLKGRELPWEELAEFASPPYWGWYVFHDNNRDGMGLTQALTRAVHGVFYRFRPQVVHDLHESLPLLHISTGHGPYNPAIDPVTVAEWTLFAQREAAQLQAAGLPGVWTWGFWDGWWPGYLFSVANNHNAVGRFYETFGNVSAETFTRDLSEIRFVGEPVTEVEWYRPWPPDAEVDWSLRNNTNYMQAGVLEALTTAVRHRRDLLFNHWVKAERSLEKGRTEPPHGWIFPPGQRDPARLDHLVNLLRQHRIEVHRLNGELSLEDGAFPSGSYVVRMDQPHRNAAVGFLSRQDFPADEPHPPYDDVAWTWPLLFGVEGEPVDDPAILDVPIVAGVGAVETAVVDGKSGEGSAPGAAVAGEEAEGAAPDPAPSLEPVVERVHAEGEITGLGEEVFLLEDRGQTSLLTARVALGEDYQVDAVGAPFEAAGRTWPAGSWIVYAPRHAIEPLARELGLSLEGVLSLPDVAGRHVVDLPRLGVVHTWTATQDAGWVRYSLDRARMPYELVSPEDLQAGNLASRFDVLLFADTRGDLRRIVHGIDPAHGPLAYTETPEFPSHGKPDGSPDITGGMGFEGLLELQRFVRQGGVLVALANAATLAVDGGLVRGVDRVEGDFHTPGSELRARVLRRDHPLTWGYDELPSVFRGHGPLWQVEERKRSRVVMQFGAEPPEGMAGEGAGEAGRADRRAGEEGERGSLLVEEELMEAELSSETAPPAVAGAAGGEHTGEAGEAGEGSAAGGARDAPGGAREAQGAGGPGEADGGTSDTSEPTTGDEGYGQGEPEGADAAATGSGELVLSGYVRGEEQVAGKPAILDLPVGEGRVILFAFDPLHRHLNLSDFRFAWNAVLYWNDLPED